MSLYRISTRFPKSFLARLQSSLLVSARQNQPAVSSFSNQFHSLGASQNKVVSGQVSSLHHSFLNTTAIQRFGFSSSASPETSENENTKTENDAASATSGGGETPEQKDTSDSEDELSREDLVSLVKEKDELIKVNEKELEKMQEKVLRTYAEMQNVMERTRREADNSKKFAIQSFAKNLLDVADNLNRASSVVKESFAKIDVSEDTSGAVHLLKTLLEGVEMTEKQLLEVFKKFGVEKYEPINEQFDPNRHNAVFQVPDASKEPDTVAAVLKGGEKEWSRPSRPILLPDITGRSSSARKALFCCIPVFLFFLLQSKGDFSYLESFCGVLCLLFFCTFFFSPRGKSAKRERAQRRKAQTLRPKTK